MTIGFTKLIVAHNGRLVKFLVMMKTYLKFTGYSKRAKIILGITAPAAVINFLAFSFVSEWIGGDALNGYVKNGHYYLCSHGWYTEVAASVWNYSYWHAISAICGIILVFIEVAIFINTGDISWE